MRYFYEIFPAKRLIFLRFAGPVVISDVRGTTERLWSDPLYSPSYNALADLSAASFLTVSPSEAKAFGKFVADHPKSTVGRVGAVLSTPLETALALIFQGIVRTRTPLKVFSTWEAACRYVGAEVDRSRIREI